MRKRHKQQVTQLFYTTDVKDVRYGPDYIKKFDIVMNALDNLSARRHVNRLCLASNVPLIESGTAGYLGQISVHLKVTYIESPSFYFIFQSLSLSLSLIELTFISIGRVRVLRVPAKASAAYLCDVHHSQ